MINKTYVNNIDRNVFTPLQSNSGVNYAISTPITEEQKHKTEEAKSRKVHTIGYSIATTALVLGLGTLALAKGLPRPLRHKFTNFFKNVDDKIIDMKQNPNLTQDEKMQYKLLRIVKKIGQNSKAIYTFSSIKDGVTKKITDAVPFLKKSADVITDWFEKVSVKTLNRSYNQTYRNFEHMYAAFDKANAKLPAHAVREIQTKTDEIQDIWKNGFSQVQRLRRLKEMKSDMEGIDKEVQDRIFKDVVGFIKDPKSRQTFLSEEVAKEAKLKTNSKLNIFRSTITNGIYDNYRVTKKLLSEIDAVVDPADLKSKNILKEIRTTLRIYKKQTEKGTDAKAILIDGNLSNKLNELNKHMQTSKMYEEGVTHEISKNINELNGILNSNKLGLTQEILAIYKKHLPEKEYNHIKKTVYKANNSLIDSVDMEGDKLFDKIRDLIIGSAPQDASSVLLSLGVIGYQLAKCDSGDERTSVALKYGIPIVGAVATTTICTVGLVSAGPSLLIGLASGAIINKLGIMADNARKKYQGKKVNENEKSIAEVGLQKLEEQAKLKLSA